MPPKAVMPVPMLFDSHAHYDDKRFFGDEVPEGRDALLSEIFRGGVGKILNAGTNPDTSRAALALAGRYPGFYAAVGVHPSDCPRYSDMDKTISEIEELAKAEKAVAIGEIGLDYHYDHSPFDVQKKWFEAQLSLARSLDLPAVIHDRDAHGDVFEILRRTKGVTAIIHSCSESAETVRQYAKMGFYISFSGTVTFKNAANVALAAAAVPADLLLAETDCPYLAPHPMRGKLNHSGYLKYTVAKLAEIRGVSYEEAEDLTYRNALRVFRISDTEERKDPK